MSNYHEKVREYEKTIDSLGHELLEWEDVKLKRKYKVPEKVNVMESHGYFDDRRHLNVIEVKKLLTSDECKWLIENTEKLGYKGTLLPSNHDLIFGILFCRY
jgi:hypothetical protein